jgi:hypothetical protein
MVGRTISVLAPQGEAEFNGAAFVVRAQADRIESGRFVLVTGFDPWTLTVREATAEEVATQPPPTAPERAGSEGKGGLLVVGALVFGALLVAGSLWSFQVGELAFFGYLVAMAGEMWLLVLLIRECRPDALVLALLIPFFLWYFAWQRWDIARWPFLVSVLGLVVTLGGCVGAG